MKKRYPGPMPFSYDDRNLFFGREQEIEYLTTLIINNQITILHGKSGYGKSSLINAGLVPNLLESFDCEIIRVRFYNYDKANPMLPLDTFLRTVAQHVSGKPYLDGLLPGAQPSAWRYFKKLHHGVLKKFPSDAEGSHVAQLSYILVIDQFEELFTYPKEAVIELAKALQEVLLHRIPEEYQEALKESFRNRENLEAYKDELSILDKDIPLKVIFSLRTERFNYLTHLVNYIPALLNNTYKVRRMTPMQVRTAIIEPALVADEGFDSPPFTYKESIVQNLIDFLDADTKGEGGKIEVFEMQIICQRLETLLVDYLANQPHPPATLPVLFKEDVILQNATIKDKQNPYAEIIKNYYKETLETIPEAVEQLAARYLIEFKLIDSATGNRISLDNAFVKEIGISDVVLRHLIDRRIIRVEVNTVSGHSLEISHDSLVPPILNAAAELSNLTAKLNAFYEAAVETETPSGHSVRDIINNILLEEKETRKAAAAELNEDDFAVLRTNPVITEKPLKTGSTDIYAFGVKKIFHQTAQQSRANVRQSSTRSWVRRFSIISMVLVGVIAAALYIYSESKRRENRLRSLLFLNVVDTIPNKRDALRLTYYIHRQNVLYAQDSLILRKKLLDLLQSQEAQAQFSYLSIAIPSSNLKREEIALSHNGDYAIYNFKRNDEETPSGRYFFCDKNGRVLRQFEKILYTYFTNRNNIAVLAVASSGSDSIYSSANKFARAFILFDCTSGRSETITLRPGHYLYPPNYGLPAQTGSTLSYRVHFNDSGSLIVPVYDPVLLPSSNHITLLSSSGWTTDLIPVENSGIDAMNEASLPNEPIEPRVRLLLQDWNNELIGVGVKNSGIVYKTRNIRDRSETLWRSNASGTAKHSFSYSEGIQSAEYNGQADATLVYTKDNRLYLLDSVFQIRAGFQLTANDLYGFSEKGNRFFYVRNEALSFFDNNASLINVFNYEQVLRWLQRRFENGDKTTLQHLKNQYELDF